MFYGGVAAPVETSKDSVGLFLWDADSLVLDFQTDVAVKPMEPHGYRAVSRRIFDCVVQKVCDRLGGPTPVQKQGGTGIGFSVGVKQFQTDIFGQGFFIYRVHGVGEQIGQNDVLLFQSDHAGFQTRDID